MILNVGAPHLRASAFSDDTFWNDERGIEEKIVEEYESVVSRAGTRVIGAVLRGDYITVWIARSFANTFDLHSLVGSQNVARWIRFARWE